jgi:ferredoxin-NADP reductase
VADLALRVTSVRMETAATRVLRLDLGGAAFTYKAGQAAEIGPAGSPYRVPYSIASAPEETSGHGWLEFLIKLHPDGRWGRGFEVPRRGASIAVRGPAGRFAFPDAPEERRFLFIGGGTGIAPLRSMIRQALCRRQPGRMRVLYSARTADDFSYRRELRTLARAGSIELTLTATREPSQSWRGGRGRITVAHLAPLVDDAATLCFVCGPAAMVHDVPLFLQELGIERRRIRVEEWN